MKAAGGDAQVQVDAEVERREHRQRRVLGIAGSRAQPLAHLALKHQDHQRDQSVIVAELAEDRAGRVERKIADNLLPAA